MLSKWIPRAHKLLLSVNSLLKGISWSQRVSNLHGLTLLLRTHRLARRALNQLSFQNRQIMTDNYVICMIVVMYTVYVKIDFPRIAWIAYKGSLVTDPIIYTWLKPHYFMHGTKLLQILWLTTLQCRRRSKDLFSLIFHTRHYISLLSTQTPCLALHSIVEIHWPLLRFPLMALTFPGYRWSIILSVFGVKRMQLVLYCTFLDAVSFSQPFQYIQMKRFTKHRSSKVLPHWAKCGFVSHLY